MSEKEKSKILDLAEIQSILLEQVMDAECESKIRLKALDLLFRHIEDKIGWFEAIRWTGIPVKD